MKNSERQQPQGNLLRPPLDAGNNNAVGADLTTRPTINIAGATSPLILVGPDLLDGAADATEKAYVLRENYITAIAQAGGVALILPLVVEQLAQVLSRADGVVITGSRPGANVPEERDRKSTRLNSSHVSQSRMPSSA